VLDRLSQFWGALQGISYVISNEEFARAVAGVSASELLGAVVDFLVAEGMSR
jgi:hypothetical protein